MSDLAPLVAAALRDKVVAELQDEIRDLQHQLLEERRQSQMVCITGPRGTPVYAQASFRKDGKYDYSPELWKVEFPAPSCSPSSTRHHQNKKWQNNTSTNNLAYCSLAQLADMEVRIGGVCKARLSNGIVEGFVNDLQNNFDREHESGAVSIWFGGSSGIWLTIRIHPIARAQYAALRDFDLAGENLMGTLNQFFTPSVQVSFTEVSFLISYINGAMEHWKIIAPDEKEEQDMAELHSEELIYI